MKKNLLLVLPLLIAGGVFAQEYTIYLGGSVGGIITVQKERSGKITITGNARVACRQIPVRTTKEKPL